MSVAANECTTVRRQARNEAADPEVVETPAATQPTSAPPPIRTESLNKRNGNGNRGGTNTEASQDEIIPGVPNIKAPSEGGDKRKLDMTLERLKHHVVSMWNGGSDVAEMLDTFEEVKIEEPVDLSVEDKASVMKTANRTRKQRK